MKKYRSLGLGFPGDMERAINERDAFEGCEDSEDMMFREQKVNLSHFQIIHMFLIFISWIAVDLGI